MRDLRVHPVSTRGDLKAFIELPWAVYKGDPCWAPPLLSERREFFDRQKNPFFQHSHGQYFLARRGDQPVGRIAALVNSRHNHFHQERVGFFGAFEVLDDPEAAAALLQAAGEWVEGEGMTAIRGPATFSSNEEWGLLVDGSDSPPTILTSYNPPRYVSYVEQAGFTGVMDLYGYRLSSERWLPEALRPNAVRTVERLKQRSGVSLRTANMRRFWQEVELIQGIYSSAWAANWGFVPPTDLEFHQLAGMMKPILDPDLVFLVQLDGATVGFALSLPDLNQALRLAHPNPGMPEWVTLARLLWHWKVRRKIKAFRFVALGLQQDARLTGLDILLYYETARAAIAKGYEWVDVSWVLETNRRIDVTNRRMGAEIYKTWRVYERTLADPASAAARPSS